MANLNQPSMEQPGAQPCREGNRNQVFEMEPESAEGFCGGLKQGEPHGLKAVWAEGPAVSAEGREDVTPIPERGGQRCLGLWVVGATQLQKTCSGTW